MSGVYALVEQATGRAYVGGSIDIEARLFYHFNRLANDAHDNPELQAAWNAGRRFDWCLLERCPSLILAARERSWTARFPDRFNMRRVPTPTFRGNTKAAALAARNVALALLDEQRRAGLGLSEYAAAWLAACKEYEATLDAIDEAAGAAGRE